MQLTQQQQRVAGAPARQRSAVPRLPLLRPAAATKQQQVQVQVAEPPQQQQQQHEQPQAQQQKQQHALVAALPAPVRRGLGAVSDALAPARSAVADTVGKVDPRVRGLILLNAMTLLMGSNWVVVKGANDAFDPMTFTCLRFTLAAAAFTPFLLKGMQDKRIRDAGLEVGLWTAAGYLAQSWALFLTPASRASLLSTFTVIAVPCLAGLSGERVKPLVWACGIAAIVGTTLLEQGGGEPPNAGDLLSIASAVFFAIQIFRTEKTSRLLPEGSNLPYMSVILATVAAVSCACTAAVHWQDAAAALASLQVVWDRALDGLGPSDTPISAARPMFDLVYTSFCSTDLVLLIELVALQTVSSTEAALIYSLEPVSGAAMAYAFLGERWGPLGWAGAAVILAASVACQLGGAFDEDGSKVGPKEDVTQA